MRWLLIQAAVSILRRRPPQAEALRTWALHIAARRGKAIAVIALARRLAGILYALHFSAGDTGDERAAHLPQGWLFPTTRLSRGNRGRSHAWRSGHGAGDAGPWRLSQGSSRGSSIR